LLRFEGLVSRPTPAFVPQRVCWSFSSSSGRVIGSPLSPITNMPWWLTALQSKPALYATVGNPLFLTSFALASSNLLSRLSSEDG